MLNNKLGFCIHYRFLYIHNKHEGERVFGFWPRNPWSVGIQTGSLGAIASAAVHSRQHQIFWYLECRLYQDRWIHALVFAFAWILKELTLYFNCSWSYSIFAFGVVDQTEEVFVEHYDSITESIVNIVALVLVCSKSKLGVMYMAIALIVNRL